MAYTRRWWAARGPRDSFRARVGGVGSLSAFNYSPHPSSASVIGNDCRHQQLLADDFVPVSRHTKVWDSLGWFPISLCLSHQVVCFVLVLSFRLHYTVVHTPTFWCTPRAAGLAGFRSSEQVCAYAWASVSRPKLYRSHQRPKKLPTTCLILFPLFCRRGSLFISQHGVFRFHSPTSSLHAISVYSHLADVMRSPPFA